MSKGGVGVAAIVGAAVGAAAMLAWRFVEPQLQSKKHGKQPAQVAEEEAAGSSAATKQGQASGSSGSGPAYAHNSTGGIVSDAQGMGWLSSAAADGLDFDACRAAFAVQVTRRGEYEEQVNKDLLRTFPEDPNFRPGAPGAVALRRVLNAAAASNDNVYVQGMNFMAGHLLKHMGEVEAYALMTHLMSTPKLGLRPLYAAGMPGVPVASEQLRQLAAVHVPQLVRHFEHTGFSFMCIFDWYFCCFASILTPELVDRVWDRLFEHGWSYSLHVCVALLKAAQGIILNDGCPGTATAAAAAAPSAPSAPAQAGGAGGGAGAAQGTATATADASGSSNPDAVPCLSWDETMTFLKSLSKSRDAMFVPPANLVELVDRLWLRTASQVRSTPAELLAAAEHPPAGTPTAAAAAAAAASLPQM